MPRMPAADTDTHLNYGREILTRWIETIPVTSVLDIGAGHGADLGIVSKRYPAARLEAIESNVHYANALRAGGLAVTECNLERARLPFADATFDLVMANQILEHIKEIYWLLDQISRVLKVGGHFYVGVPNLASLHNRILLLAGRQPTCLNNASAHVRGFTKHDLLRTLDLCWPKGFEAVGFRGSNFYPFPPSIAGPLARLAPQFAVTIFVLLRKSREYRGEFLDHPVDMETNFFLGERIHHVVD
jgi:SAM-dependent methyltransferase